MTEQDQQRLTDFGAVLFELMRDRGVGSLNELLETASEAGYGVFPVEEFNGLVYGGLVYGEAEMLPRGGFLVPIEKVLGLNEEEEQRLFEGVKTYIKSAG